MNKIKILFTICNFDTAGSGKVLLDLATSLDKNIFEPEIIYFLIRIHRKLWLKR
jgi:hypothetical protein